MQRQRWLMIIVVILILAIGGMYLLGYNKKTTTNLTPKPTSTQTTPTPSVTVSPSVTATTSATPTGSTTAAQHEVTLTSSGFSPATLTIKAGDTVVWTNQSGAPATVNSDPHPTHTDYPPLNLGSFNNGGTLSLTFPKTGTYGYHNHLNPSQKGTIIVK